MGQVDQTASEPEDDLFVAALTPVLARVRDSLARAVDAVPAPVRTAADLRRALGLDTRLSTQIVRIARADDPLSIASQVPGKPSLKRFLERAAGLQVSPDVLAEVEAAIADFDRFVLAQAGDRVSFDSIVSNLGAHGHDAIELQHRRAAFRAMSHLLGMQASAYARACILCTNPATSLFDMAQVRGFVGVTRLRPRTPVPLFSAQLIATEGDKLDDQFSRDPIFSQAQPGLDIGAIAEFCGDDGSALRNVRFIEEMGLLSAALHGQGIGSLAASDLFFTYVEHGIKIRPTADRDSAGVNHSISIPAERFVLDLLVEADLMRTESPSAQVYLNRTGRLGTVHRPEDAVQIHPDVRRLRGVEELVQDRSLGNYGQAVDRTLKALGWDQRRYDVFRVELAYPVVSTLVRIGMRLGFEPRN